MLLENLDHILAYQRLYHADKAPPEPTLRPPTENRHRIERIAIVGAKEFNENKTTTFLNALAEKYPNTILLIGNGQGAEKFAREQAEQIGLRIHTPPLDRETWGAEAMALQVVNCCMEADVLVILGSRSGSRPTVALDWWKRCRSFTHAHRKLGKWPIHILEPPKKKTKARKTKKAHARDDERKVA